MLGMIFGPDGIVVIVVVAIVLIFGGAKLPGLARGLGSASHEFKKGVAEGDLTRADPSEVRAAVEHEVARSAGSIEHPRENGALIEGPGGTPRSP